MRILLLILPIVLGASLIEAVLRSRRGGFDWKGAGVSFLDLLGRRLLLFGGVSTSAMLLDVAWHYRVATRRLDGVMSFLVLFIGQEFLYYWYHRASHRVRWFWATHRVHHSSNQVTLSAACRIGWLQHLTGSAVFFAPLVWLGFAPKVVLAVLSLNLLYQFWLHTTWIPRLGWLEYVINTPSAHRVHHAANIDHLDANYGGVLVVFDRWFGTYVRERRETPCRFGLVKPVTTNNILRIEFDPWIELVRDMTRSRSLREVVGYLFGPPGWQPDGTGETTEDLRRRAGETRCIDGT